MEHPAPADDPGSADRQRLTGPQPDALGPDNHSIARHLDRGTNPANGGPPRLRACADRERPNRIAECPQSAIEWHRDNHGNRGVCLHRHPGAVRRPIVARRGGRRRHHRCGGWWRVHSGIDDQGRGRRANRQQPAEYRANRQYRYFSVPRAAIWGYWHRQDRLFVQHVAEQPCKGDPAGALPNWRGHTTVHDLRMDRSIQNRRFSERFPGYDQPGFQPEQRFGTDQRVRFGHRRQQFVGIEPANNLQRSQLRRQP